MESAAIAASSPNSSCATSARECDAAAFAFDDVDDDADDGAVSLRVGSIATAPVEVKVEATDDAGAEPYRYPPRAG